MLQQQLSDPTRTEQIQVYITYKMQLHSNGGNVERRLIEIRRRFTSGKDFKKYKIWAYKWNDRAFNTCLIEENKKLIEN